jgi:ABC-2 type transport system permease protein
MDKVLLIIQREYISRVKKRAFIVTTLLVPTLVLVMYGIIYLIANNSDELNKERTIFVKDESGLFAGKFHDKSKIKFKTSPLTISEAKASLKKLEDDFLLVIPNNYTTADAVQILSKRKPNFSITGEIEGQMNDIAKGNNMVKAGIDTSKLSAIKSNIHITARQLTDKGEEDSSVGAAYISGITGAILIYISLLIYGAQVMRGVLEEKTSRIVEVIISSVKPFQLMLGKIIGVGLVGLTQFVLWIVLSSGVTILAGSLFVKNNSAAVSSLTQQNQKVSNTKTQVTTVNPNTPVPPNPAMNFFNTLKTVNFPLILGSFLFYFVSGFFLYSALFAAVGSAADSETETQQFMFPITMPLLFTYILAFAFLINNPDSSLAFWLSIIPFTAPIAMMVRIPFGVPEWQLALSAFLMIAGFLLTTYVAARIYRVGILMYGKKVSYKELSKWFFYKE